MKANHLLFYVLALAGCLVACADAPGIRTKKSLGESDDLLLKFEWGGPESHPIDEVGLATEKRIDELDQWISKNPFSRHGAPLSQLECHQIFQILNSDHLQARRTKKLDDLANLQQQYYLSVSAKGEMWYIPLGVDKDGKTPVMKIKEILGSSAPSLLDPIIAFFPR